MAIAGANVVTSLNGLFKEVYADKLKNLLPDQVVVLNKVEFMAKDKTPGNLYHQPVILGLEHGITFASSDDDAFTLNAPIAGSIRDAQIKGCPAVLRSVMGYVAASRSQGSNAAFEQATKFLVANMLRSMAKKIEIEMLYGQVGYGIVDAATTTTTAIVVSAGEWASGIWSGSENMPIEVRDPTGATVRGTSTVLSVSFETKTITLSSAIAGMTAGDVIYHGGAYGHEFIGIHGILAQTTGTLFNINVGSYNMFRGNTYSAGSAALSFTKLNLAVAKGVAKGLDSKVTVLVSPTTWASLLNDQAALKRNDSSYSKVRAENGSESILFHSQNGDMEIVPSVYCKEGYAYLLSLDDWKRVGSSEMTFERPGEPGKFFRDLDSAAGYELRIYTDQAIFCSAPGRQVLITGIVNPT